MTNILRNAAGQALLDSFGTLAGPIGRATARVRLSVSPGDDGFQVGLISISDVAATHIWIGASKFVEIPIASLPAQVLWSQVTTGSAASVKLRGGVGANIGGNVRDRATWEQLLSRGDIIVEPPTTNGAIDDFFLFVGDVDYVLETRFFFNDGGGTLTYAMTVDGQPAPAGWTISSTGQFRVQGTAARPVSNVAVTVTSSLGSAYTATQTFHGEVREGTVIAPPTWTGAANAPLNLVVEEDDTPGTTTIPFGSLVSGPNLDFGLRVSAPGSTVLLDTLPTGYSLDSAGDIVVPTTPAAGERLIEATATNGSGVTLIKRLTTEIQVASGSVTMTNTTLPIIQLRAGSSAVVGGTVETTGSEWDGPTPNYGAWLFFLNGVKVQADANVADPRTWTAVSSRYVTTAAGALTAKVARISSDDDSVFAIADATGSITIAAAPVTTGVPAPTDAMLTKGMLNGANTRPPMDYDFNRYGHDQFPDHQSTGVNNKKGSFLAPIVALAAKLGITTIKGGQTPVQATIAMINSWCQDGMPAARGGLTTQVDLCAIYVICLAKQTTAVWSQISAANRTKCDLLMKGELISHMWQNSDNNFYVRGGSDIYGNDSERTITGAQYGRNRVANFITPSAIMPALCCSYFGGADIAAGATFCEDFAKTFDRGDFAAAILATAGANATTVTGGLADLYETFNRVWSSPNAFYGNKDTIKGPGPTDAQLTAAISRGVANATSPYTQYGGKRIGQPGDMLKQQIDKVYGRNVRFGKQVNANLDLSRGTTFVAGKDGVFEALTTAGSAGRGRNRQVGCGTMTMVAGATEAIHAKAAWDAGYHHYIGQVGMCSELDTMDGGSGPGDGGIRSAMTYAYEGVTIILPAILVFAVLGLADPTEASFASELHKAHVGSWDLEFRKIFGHENFAKGGPFGANAGGGNWNITWFRAHANAFDYDALDAMWFECIAPWAGYGMNTVAPSITGTPKVGVQLSAVAGTWLNSPTLVRHWQQLINDEWTDIAGETGANFTPGVAQQGRQIAIEYESTTPKGKVWKRTAATAVVAAA